jgi:hypothetical protein
VCIASPHDTGFVAPSGHTKQTSGVPYGSLGALRDTGRALFGIDPRTLAWFRIGLGTLLCIDLAKRGLTLREHYTGEGVLPRAAALELVPDTKLLHLYFLSDSPAWVTTLFVISALLAVCVIVGHRTRLALALSYFLLLSLTRRNPFVTHTGDQLLQVCVFWGMLLPLGSWFSIDRLRGREGPVEAGRRPPATVSVVTAGALLQVCIFYFMAGYLKARFDVWRDGEALAVFANVEQYTRPLGHLLAGQPTLCRLITYATLALELGAPFLLLSPWFRVPFRVATVALLTAFHLTIQLTIYIGIFQLIGIIGVSLFLPGEFWDGVARRVPADWRARWERLSGAVRARLARPPRPSSHVLRDRFRQGLAATALVFLAFTNWNNQRVEAAPLPEVVERYTKPTGLVQNWHMFTDIGNAFFGWFAVLAQDTEGNVFEVLHERPYDGLERPELFAATFPNHNERRLWWNASASGFDWVRLRISEYLCRKWARTHDHPLYHLVICQIGNVPGRKRLDWQQVRVLSRYRAPKAEVLGTGPEADARALRLQSEWKAFMAALPKRIPAY